ncbi:hypothetical protein B7463_g8736, partial [Scytalidium lignicola]
MALNQLPFFPAASHFSTVNSPHLTTPSNPARLNGALDYMRCAALHNEILSRGWLASGREREEMPDRNWSAYHGADAEAVRNRLSPDLVSFLERAIQVGDGDNFSLFYYVNGLRYPDILWINHEDHGDRFLTLYSSNLDSKPDGLIFDQQENKAIISIALQLQETIDVYNQLVDAIIAAMPENAVSQLSTERPLLDDATLDAAHVPFGFAREFLSKAKSTPFRYIAPGLSLPTAETFASQPFADVPPDPLPEEDEESQVINPILLFRSAELYSAPPDYKEPSGSDLPFGWPYNEVSSYAAGLYLNGADRGDGNVFEDEAKLVLPFPIGASGYARKSDGSRIREDHGRGEGLLYQPGYQPFVEGHGVRLVGILRSWIGMVERGDWKVGLEGVLGDIKVFKEADTEDGWENFLVPLTGSPAEESDYSMGPHWGPMPMYKMTFIVALASKVVRERND